MCQFSALYLENMDELAGTFEWQQCFFFVTKPGKVAILFSKQTAFRLINIKSFCGAVALFCLVQNSTEDYQLF